MQGQSPCPRSAERGTLLCLFERRRGSKGEPSPGVPPLFIIALLRFVRVRRRLHSYEDTPAPACIAGAGVILSAVKRAQRNGIEQLQAKRFSLGGSTIRVSAACLGGRGSSSPDLGQGTGAGLGPLRRLCGGSTVQGHGRFLLPPNTLYSRSKRQAKGFYLSPVLSYALR